MALKLLLDTNAYSQLKRGQLGIAALVRSAARIYVSSVGARFITGATVVAEWPERRESSLG